MAHKDGVVIKPKNKRKAKRSAIQALRSKKDRKIEKAKKDLYTDTDGTEHHRPDFPRRTTIKVIKKKTRSAIKTLRARNRKKK